MRRWQVAGLSWVLGACAPGDDGLPDDSPLRDATKPLPPTLGELGLYPNAPDLTDVPSVAIGYAPSYPLYSNGSDKTRHVVVPPGERIDTTDPDAWVYPRGTLIFKTFGYDGVPVETRVLVKSVDDGEWGYAVYQWDDTGTDGTRLSLDDRVAVPQDGFEHTIPAELDCKLCHQTAPHPVLGLTRAQLAGADGGDGLEALASVLDDTPNPAAPIDTGDTASTEILRYFYGNCVHCHNGGRSENASFDLRPEVALANTIDQPTQSSASADGTRIVPGDPSTSILFLALSGEHDDPDLQDMPPVGIDRRDAETIGKLRTFIEAL